MRPQDSRHWHGSDLFAGIMPASHFFYLKNLPIAPPQCYEQVCKVWAEFQPAVCRLLENNLRQS